jgi:tRNA-dihydrouridine synthase A
VHARKAILKGLSPKENREIPPLDYDRVLKLKTDFPHLNIIINGGIKTLDMGKSLMDKGLDGVMLGREAYQNPLILQTVDSTLYNQANRFNSNQDLKQGLTEWLGIKLEEGIPLKYLARHMLGLFPGKPGARQFRRHLSENMTKPDANLEVFETAIELIKVD